MSDTSARPRRHIGVAIPECVHAALEQAVERDLTSVSEFTRRAIVTALREAGIDPLDHQHP